MNRIRFTLLVVLLFSAFQGLLCADVVFVNNTGSTIKIRVNKKPLGMKKNGKSKNYEPEKLIVADGEAVVLKDFKEEWKIDFCKVAEFCGFQFQKIGGLFNDWQYKGNMISLKPEKANLLVVIRESGSGADNYMLLDTSCFKGGTRRLQELSLLIEAVEGASQELEAIKEAIMTIESQLKNETIDLLYLMKKRGEEVKRMKVQFVEWKKLVLQLKAKACFVRAAWIRRLYHQFVLDINHLEGILSKYLDAKEAGEDSEFFFMSRSLENSIIGENEEEDSDSSDNTTIEVAQRNVQTEVSTEVQEDIRNTENEMQPVQQQSEVSTDDDIPELEDRSEEDTLDADAPPAPKMDLDDEKAKPKKTKAQPSKRVERRRITFDDFDNDLKGAMADWQKRLGKKYKHEEKKIEKATGNQNFWKEQILFYITNLKKVRNITDRGVFGKLYEKIKQEIACANSRSPYFRDLQKVRAEFEKVARAKQW